MKVLSSSVAYICLLCGVAIAQAHKPEVGSPRKPEGGHPRKFVEFLYRSFADAQPNLDNMGIEMQLQPELIGYVYVYAGRRACPDEARTRGESLKRYLVESYGLAGERVVWKDGGHREEAAVELWVLPPKVSEPLAMPDPKIKEAEVGDDCEGEEPQGAGAFDESGGHNKGIKPTRHQRAL